MFDNDIYIDDAVDGIMKIIRKFNKASGNTFNISKSKSERLIDVAKIIKTELKSESKITSGNIR